MFVIVILYEENKINTQYYEPILLLALNSPFGTAVCCKIQSERLKIWHGEADRCMRQYHYLQAHNDTFMFAVCTKSVIFLYISCISGHHLVISGHNHDFHFLLRWRRRLLTLFLHAPAWVELNSLESHSHLQQETNGALKACLSSLSPAWKISLPWLPFFQ